MVNWPITPAEQNVTLKIYSRLWRSSQSACSPKGERRLFSGAVCARRQS